MTKHGDSCNGRVLNYDGLLNHYLNYTLMKIAGSLDSIQHNYIYDKSVNVELTNKPFRNNIMSFVLINIFKTVLIHVLYELAV